MSANNQTLVTKYKGKWYVFGNVTAESWCGWDEKADNPLDKPDNSLFVSQADSVHDNYADALVAAHKLDEEEWTEYGVHSTLAKDGAKVRIKPVKATP
jgi:hypothetical protein